MSNHDIDHTESAREARESEFAAALRAAGERRRAEIGGPPPAFLSHLQSLLQETVGAKIPTEAASDAAAGALDDRAIWSLNERDLAPFPPLKTLPSADVDVLPERGPFGELIHRPISHPRWRDRQPRVLAFIAASLVIIVGIVMVFRATTEQGNPGQGSEPAPIAVALLSPGTHVQVLIQSLLYVEARPTSRPFTTLPQGAVVEVIDGPNNAFYQINWDGVTGWVSAYLVAQTSEPLTSRARASPELDVGPSIVDYAMRFRGYPYVAATIGPASFDVTGFTYWVVLNTVGIDIGRTTLDQWNTEGGRHVAKEDLQPGDLVFFEGAKTQELSHVGIYIGNEQFIHAQNEETGVAISSLTAKYFATRWYGALRIQPGRSVDERWVAIDWGAATVSLMVGNETIASFPATLSYQYEPDGINVARGSFYVYAIDAGPVWAERGNAYVKWWVAFDSERQRALQSVGLDADGGELPNGNDPVTGAIVTDLQVAEQIYNFVTIGTRIHISQ